MIIFLQPRQLLRLLDHTQVLFQYIAVIEASGISIIRKVPIHRTGFAFLISSQVILILLSQGPHFEESWGGDLTLRWKDLGLKKNGNLIPFSHFCFCIGNMGIIPECTLLVQMRWLCKPSWLSFDKVYRDIYHIYIV